MALCEPSSGRRSSIWLPSFDQVRSKSKSLRSHSKVMNRVDTQLLDYSGFNEIW